MKNLQLFIVLLLTLLLLECNVTDSNTNNFDDNSSNNDAMNGDGQYDGTWRLIYEHDYGYNDFKFNEVPEMNFLDIDSGAEVYSDTSFLLSLVNDSGELYIFDPEVNTDTFLIEHLTLELLDEYEPEDYGESDIESLKSSLKSRFSIDSIIEISNFTVESIDEIAASNDTLKITFGFHTSADFAVIKNDEIITGSYNGEIAGIYKLARYSGNLPPDSWPENYVEEFSDEDDIDNNGDDQIESTPLNSWRLILLPKVSLNIQDSTEISLTIYEEFSSTSSTGVDTVYVLSVSHITQTSPTGIILQYESYGSASVINDKVVISGIFCKLLNSATQKMESLSSEDCEKPINLPTTKLSKYEWIIPGEVMINFPFFTEDQKSALSNSDFKFTSPNYDEM